MDINTGKKTYATPSLAAHGSVIAKTEDGLPFPPREDDGTGTQVI